MDFLGIGPMELIAILLILFVVMGPSDLVKMGSTLGRALRKFRLSGTWRAVQNATRELRSLPNTLARQAGIDEVENLTDLSGLKEIEEEIESELEKPKAVIQDLDRQFTAWKRKTGRAGNKAPAIEDEKENPTKKTDTPSQKEAKGK